MSKLPRRRLTKRIVANAKYILANFSVEKDPAAVLPGLDMLLRILNSMEQNQFVGYCGEIQQFHWLINDVAMVAAKMSVKAHDAAMRRAEGRESPELLQKANELVASLLPVRGHK